MSGKYIVVFKDGVTKDQIQKYADDIKTNGGEIGHTYDSMNGFSATIPDASLSSLQSLVGDVVEFIEPDGVVTTQS
ncbi:hypothetical protein C8J56DRAFT_928269 [Mycena floridula]|nr:hypothetical protein C8J56DRAFT_928269 [Mycena floridula]